MHERLKTIEHQPVLASEVEETPEVTVDLHHPLLSENLRSLEDGQSFRIESERRMLNLETPKTLTEIKRDHAHLIGKNLEALRQQKLQAALGENATKESFGLAG